MKYQELLVGLFIVKRKIFCIDPNLYDEDLSEKFRPISKWTYQIKKHVLYQFPLYFFY